MSGMHVGKALAHGACPCFILGRMPRKRIDGNTKVGLHHVALL
jgi:hypothetical protein